MRTDTIERFVEIGVVGRPHGVTGEVRIFLHNPESTAILSSQILYLAQSNGRKRIRLSDFRAGSRCHLARIEGIGNRASAEALKGAKILIPRDALPSVDEDEFYVTDLIGLAAFWNETPLGEITSSRPQGGIEVVTVTGDREALEIPLVEDFVEELNIKGGRVDFKEIDDLPRYRVRQGRKKY